MIKVALTIFLATFTVSREEAKMQADLMRQKFSEVGVDVHYRLTRIKAKRYSIHQAGNIARKRGLKHVHIMTPPTPIGGFMDGWGFVCGNASVATSQRLNRLGWYRYCHSVYGMTHEVEHQFGAEHVASPTIMNRDILWNYDALYGQSVMCGGIPWGFINGPEIKRCLRKN